MAASKPASGPEGQKGTSRQRIPPSKKVRQRVADLMAHGTDPEEMATTIIRLGEEGLVHDVLEEEVKLYPSREHYERRIPDQEHRGCRSGYEPGRVRTGEGEVTAQVPKCETRPRRTELS